MGGRANMAELEAATAYYIAGDLLDTSVAPGKYLRGALLPPGKGARARKMGKTLDPEASPPGVSDQEISERKKSGRSRDYKP